MKLFLAFFTLVFVIFTSLLILLVSEPLWAQIFALGS